MYLYTHCILSITHLCFRYDWAGTSTFEIFATGFCMDICLQIYVKHHFSLVICAFQNTTCRAKLNGTFIKMNMCRMELYSQTLVYFCSCFWVCQLSFPPGWFKYCLGKSVSASRTLHYKNMNSCYHYDFFFCVKIRTTVFGYDKILHCCKSFANKALKTILDQFIWNKTYYSIWSSLNPL